MSINSEIERIKQGKEDLRTSIENKGVAVDEGALIDTYHDYVDKISIENLGGIDINGVIKNYQVAAGNTVNAGDFVKFIQEQSNNTEAYSLVENEIISKDEIHLINTKASKSTLYKLQISRTEPINDNEITLVISNKSKTETSEVEKTEIILQLEEDVDEGTTLIVPLYITYENGVFYNADVGILVQNVSLYDNDTYIYVKDYDNLRYYVKYDRYISVDDADISVADMKINSSVEEPR